MKQKGKPRSRYRLFLALLIVVVMAGGLATWAARRRGSPTEHTFPFPLLLDMSHPVFNDSPPEYLRVLPSDIYTPERGFGWSYRVQVFDANTWPDDRLNLNSLHRDAHLGLNVAGQPGAVFRIDVPPGSYRLTVITGSAVHGPHALGILVNGEEVLSLTRAPPDGKPRVYELTLGPRDGRIELLPFTEFGTEWLISAIELRRLPRS